ncbi:hypothetical protein EDD85DRAFT_792012 [Armillaria nabsnona]|nr:hypothetical protein EDD85DRAFT_792012 [Armillaria nabsnona]
MQLFYGKDIKDIKENAFVLDCRPSSSAKHGQSYDQVREILERGSVNASGKVELEDWVEGLQLNVKLHWQATTGGGIKTAKAKMAVLGSNANMTESNNIMLTDAKTIGCSMVNIGSADIQEGKKPRGALSNADKSGCRKFLTPSSLIAGNRRLNSAFVANVFNTHSRLGPLTEVEKTDYGAVEDFDAAVLLGVESCMFNLIEDLRDRLLIPQAFDKISPGVVVWRPVSKPKEGKGENLDVYVSGGAVGEADEDVGMQSKAVGIWSVFKVQISSMGLRRFSLATDEFRFCRLRDVERVSKDGNDGGGSWLSGSTITPLYVLSFEKLYQYSKGTATSDKITEQKTQTQPYPPSETTQVWEEEEVPESTHGLRSSAASTEFMYVKNW